MSAIGTKRTYKPALMNVRFEGNNGHDAEVARFLLMTQYGHQPRSGSRVSPAEATFVPLLDRMSILCNSGETCGAHEA